MDAVTAQIHKVYDASGRLIQNSNQIADELIKAGKYHEATETIHHMLDGIEAKNEIVHSALHQRAENIYKAIGPSTSPTSASSTKSMLPKGISNGEIAGVAAAIAVIGGGILLYRNAQHKKQNSWATRIEQERMMSTQKVPSFSTRI